MSIVECASSQRNNMHSTMSKKISMRMCLFKTLQPYDPMLKIYKRNSSLPSACQATHTRTHPHTHTH